MNVLKRLSHCWILLAVLGASHAHAATTDGLYHVEVLVFEHLTKTQIDEKWPIFAGLPELEKAAIIDDVMQEYNIKSIPESDWILTKQDRTLRNGKHYRVLSHQAWEAPISPSIPVHFTGEQQGESFEVEGTILLKQPKSLQIKADLLYRSKEAQDEQLEGFATRFAMQESVGFRLTQTRTIKPKEVHYLDHPKFGVLVTVMPIEREIVEEKTEEYSFQSE